MSLIFNHVFFPNRCRNCKRILSSETEILCIECFDLLPFNHWDITSENPIQTGLQSISLVKGASALLKFHHRNITQKLLHELKFFHQPQIGEYFSFFAYSELKQLDVDYVAPVPNHVRTLRARGYNQVLGFASGIAELKKVECKPRLLKRVKRKKSQVKKGLKKRVSSLENAFICPQPDELKNKKILLVDDVFTTGTTIKSCVKALDNASEIWVYTLAKAD